MLAFPKAKINIGLHVVRRRSDGYHDLETVFYAIPLRDILEILPSVRGMSFDDNGWDTTLDREDNLVWRAYSLLKSTYFPELPDIEIILRKIIPAGAGLGGGSSDAAMMLVMLRKMFELPMTDDDLRAVAKRLGADCPFFINPTPHYAEGIGDKLTPINIDLSGMHFYLVLPDIHVSTKEAYAGVVPTLSKYDLRVALLRPVSEWRECVVNDFEKSVFARYPQLKNIKDKLYECGAEYASMSGSGAAIYALSPTPLDLHCLRRVIPYPIRHFIL